MRRLTCLAIATVTVAVVSAGTTAVRDPFAFFGSVVAITASERTSLAEGDVLVRVLPAQDGELSVFAASRIDAPGDALVSWTREIAELKRSAYVLALDRFSDPPSLSDLDRLTLDRVDLDAIRRCRPEDCEIKLTADEIQRLRVVIAGAGHEWEEAAQGEFRRLILARVAAYRAGGLAALPAAADRRDAPRPGQAFRAILDASPYLRDRLPDIAARLEGFPNVEASVAASFLYWSKEQYGAGKPVIAITHVEVVRPEGRHLPEVLVLSKEIFATHYRDASLGLSAITGDAISGRYLVYLNRSRTDLLGGLLGGLKRKLIEGRMRSEAAMVLELVRQRLEGGAPERARPVE